MGSNASWLTSQMLTMETKEIPLNADELLEKSQQVYPN